MDALSFFKWLNNDVLAIPTTILFLGVGIVLTLKTRFIQIRAFPYFFRLLTQGFARKQQQGKQGEMKTINSFHALFAAMATTIGMGNVVGPSIAIMTGGPGALVWLVVYIFFGSVTKFTEVTFALSTRITTADGHIIGGPMQYLTLISPFLARLYSVVMIFLFAIWSGLQANTLAGICAQEHIPEWQTGVLLVIIVFIVLRGGAKRVGAFASKLVPIMFLFYVSFASLILVQDLTVLRKAIMLIINSTFSSVGVMGGFLGASVFQAMSAGINKGIYITEAGLGTSSIAHSMADTKQPVDQGILAMFSMIADLFLCIISGLLIVVTGVWMFGEFRSTLMYEIFKMHSPNLGQFVLFVSISLFIITTIIGNSFNGRQSFASLTRYRWLWWYLSFVLLVIFLSTLMHAELVWEISNTFLFLVAVPNLIGIVLLTFKKPDVLKI